MKRGLIILFILISGAFTTSAEELIYIDISGVMRWTKDKSEVSLFGANYCLPSACDYRAAGYVGGNYKRMIEEDLDHFKRMNWDGLRLCFWGDFQNTDKQGNLIDNIHLELLDYLIAEADKRGIYMLLSPIVTYSSQWPDIQSDTSNTGFAKYYPKHKQIYEEEAIKAQENYWRQLLNHKNRYTGLSLKDEPKILFLELINEPTPYPDDIEGVTRYINRLIGAINSTGCDKPTFYNVSQNFKMSPAIVNSKVQGATFAWYPSGLNSNRAFEGNGLLMVDRYEQMLNPLLNGMPKIVYEFDSSDMTNGYMLPAMVREFRRGGVQFATLFSYDMLRTAPMNLGWQSHYINMVYTPSKSVSSMIAAEVLRRVPRGKHFGYYPENSIFDDFKVSYDEMLSELNSDSIFYYSNTTSSMPKNIQQLMHVAGVGSSAIVKYSGTGIYFIDKLDSGSWQLEVYPDIMKLDDPFKVPNKHKNVRKTVYRNRNIEINLPNLELSMIVKPGKYVFANGELVYKEDFSQKKFFQEKLGNWQINNKTIKETTTKQNIVFRCEVFGDEEPDGVSLYLMSKPWSCEKVNMNFISGFTYEAIIKKDQLSSGFYNYHFGIESKGDVLLFPAKTFTTPLSWDYYKQETYNLTLLPETMPLGLVGTGDDWTMMRYTRTFKSPEVTFKQEVNKAMASIYILSVKSLEMNNNYNYPCDATLSYCISNKISQRNISEVEPKSIRIKASGMNSTDKAIITFVDKEGRGFGTIIELSKEVSNILIPVSKLMPTKSVMFPQDWPGVNSYWYQTSFDNCSTLDWATVKFVQVSLRDELYKEDELKNKGMVIEEVELLFD